MSELPEAREISRDLLSDTVEQIKKDLKIERLEVSFEQSASPYEQIFSALLPHVNDALVKNTISLPQLLYQIDLNESAANESISSEKPQLKLTDLIIRRCFQKVVLRKFYKP